MPTEQSLRIWSLQCPFNKHGVPVMGSFGSTERTVIVMTVTTWSELCKRVEGLATQRFEVGTYGD